MTPVLCSVLLISWLMLVEAMAQSPFDGTWRLDTNASQPSTYHYHYLLKDGIYHCTTCDPPIEVRADGQDHKITGDPCSDTASVKVVDDRTTEETEKKNGKVVGTLRMVVSADGKTATDDWTELQCQRRCGCGAGHHESSSRGPSRSTCNFWFLESFEASEPVGERGPDHAETGGRYFQLRRSHRPAL